MWSSARTSARDVRTRVPPRFRSPRSFALNCSRIVLAVCTLLVLAFPNPAQATSTARDWWASASGTLVVHRVIRPLTPETGGGSESVILPVHTRNGWDLGLTVGRRMDERASLYVALDQVWSSADRSLGRIPVTLLQFGMRFGSPDADVHVLLSAGMAAVRTTYGRDRIEGVGGVGQIGIAVPLGEGSILALDWNLGARLGTVRGVEQEGFYTGFAIRTL